VNEVGSIKEPSRGSQIDKQGTCTQYEDSHKLQRIGKIFVQVKTIYDINEKL